MDHVNEINNEEGNNNEEQQPQQPLPAYRESTPLLLTDDESEGESEQEGGELPPAEEESASVVEAQQVEEESVAEVLQEALEEVALVCAMTESQNEPHENEPMEVDGEIMELLDAAEDENQPKVGEEEGEALLASPKDHEASNPSANPMEDDILVIDNEELEKEQEKEAEEAKKRREEEEKKQRRSQVVRGQQEEDQERMPFAPWLTDPRTRRRPCPQESNPPEPPRDVLESLINFEVIRASNEEREKLGDTALRMRAERDARDALWKAWRRSKEEYGLLLASARKQAEERRRMVPGKSKVRVDEVVLEFQIEKRIEESKAAQISLDDGSGDEDLPVMGNVEATTRKEHHRMANENPEAYLELCGQLRREIHRLDWKTKAEREQEGRKRKTVDRRVMVKEPERREAEQRRGRRNEKGEYHPRRQEKPREEGSRRAEREDQRKEEERQKERREEHHKEKEVKEKKSEEGKRRKEDYNRRRIIVDLTPATNNSIQPIELCIWASCQCFPLQFCQIFDEGREKMPSDLSWVALEPIYSPAHLLLAEWKARHRNDRSEKLAIPDMLHARPKDAFMSFWSARVAEGNKEAKDVWKHKALIRAVAVWLKSCSCLSARVGLQRFRPIRIALWREANPAMQEFLSGLREMLEKAFNTVKQMKYCPASLMVDWEDNILCGDDNATRLHQRLPKGKAKLVQIGDTANLQVEPPFYPATATKVFMISATTYNNYRYYGGIAMALAGQGLNVSLAFVGKGMEDLLQALGQRTSSRLIAVKEEMTPELDTKLLAMWGLVELSQPPYLDLHPSTSALSLPLDSPMTMKNMDRYAANRVRPYEVMRRSRNRYGKKISGEGKSQWWRKNGGACFLCTRPGHYVRDCPELKFRQRGRAEREGHDRGHGKRDRGAQIRKARGPCFKLRRGMLIPTKDQ